MGQTGPDGVGWGGERPANIGAAEIKRLAATMGLAAIAKQLRIATSHVYRLMEGPAEGAARTP